MAAPVVATGSRHGLRYIAEVDPGVTPTTPEMVSLRHKTCGLVLSKESLTSEELRDDRQIADFRLAGDKVGGDIGFELSYGEYDGLLEAALGGTWATNILKAGTALKTFTFERAFLNIGAFARFGGCAIKTLNLSIKPNAMVTGTFGIVGMSGVYETTALDESPTASQTNPPLDAFSGGLKEAGTTIAVVTGIDLTLDNGTEPHSVVGQKQAAFLSQGRSKLTGSATVFFTDLTLLNKFRNETETSLEITVGSGSAKSYKILIPRLKFSGGDNPTQNEGPQTLTMPFQALRDPVTSTNIQITRIP